MEPTNLIQLFIREPDQKIIKAGETIFIEGEHGEEMYGVIEGEIDMYVNNKVVETIEPGDIFGEGALVHTAKQRYSTAIAKTDVKLVVLNRERFLFLVQETPLFALDVVRSYSNRLIRLKHSL